MLVHRLFGTFQQFVDAHGAPRIEVRDSRVQRQRGKIAAARRPVPGAQHDGAARGVLRTRRQGRKLIAAQTAEHLIDPIAGVQITHEIAHLPHHDIACGAAHGVMGPLQVARVEVDQMRGAHIPGRDVEEPRADLHEATPVVQPGNLVR